MCTSTARGWTWSSARTPRPTPTTWPGPGPGWPPTTFTAWSHKSPCTPAARLEPVLRLVGPAGSASVVHDLIYGGHTIQVRPPRVSKWSGVLAFCAEQGLDPGRILAVGDGANDLELLEGAAVACAVATAGPAVLARADHLIGPPDRGGWAAVLDMVGRPGAAP